MDPIERQPDPRLSNAVLGAASLRAGEAAAPSSRPVRVSLPELKLNESEYIQSVTFELRGARILAVKQLPDDWDSESKWDTPDLLVFRCTARHFSNGLSSTKAFDDVLTVEQLDPRGAVFRIEAALELSSTDPTGRSDRKINVADEDIRKETAFENHPENAGSIPFRQTNATPTLIDLSSHYPSGLVDGRLATPAPSWSRQRLKSVQRMNDGLLRAAEPSFKTQRMVVEQQ